MWKFINYKKLKIIIENEFQFYQKIVIVIRKFLIKKYIFIIKMSYQYFINKKF